MKKGIDVLVFGDLCVDLIIKDKDVYPEFGQKEKMVNDYSLEMGGSCSIFACQTAKLGLKTVVAGKLGQDSFGDLIIKTLEEAGADISRIKKSGLYKTGLSTILSTIEDRAILTYNGTIDAVEIEDINDDLLKDTRHFHLGSYFLMKKIQPWYPEILGKLKKWGATISLDINWDPEEKWDSGLKNILPMVDIFFPNENEAMAVTGEDNAEKAIEKLKDIIPIVAVKKGKDGAIVYFEGKTFSQHAIPGEKVDAVGAGDSFDGGFIYGYLSGMDIEACLRAGNICGSLNTRKAGGTRGQPDLKTIKEYLQP